jgi:DNA-binding MarR family transcriptional regulator/DNA-binding Xre family transcriptional regulator
MKPRGIAAILKRMRARVALSQRDLAARVGIHQPQVSKAESGEDLLVSRLQAMAQALGCELMLIPAQWSAELSARIEQQQRPPRLPAVSVGAAPPLGKGLSLTESYRREWPGVDPQVFVVIAYIQRAAQLIIQGTEQLARRHGMNAGELLVLGALRRLGAPYQSSMSKLRKQFWISLPGMSKRILNLERLGLVERVGNPRDRRGSLVRLTRKGFDIQERQVITPSREFTLICEMDPNERARLSESLARLLRAFEGSGGPPQDEPAAD